MHRRHFALYGVFQMALILAIILFFIPSFVFAQVDPIGVNIPTTFTYDSTQVKPLVIYAFDYCFKKYGFNVTLDNSSNPISITIDNTKRFSGRNSQGNLVSNLGVASVNWWVTGGTLVGTKVGYETQMCLQITMRVFPTNDNVGTGDALYFICWHNLKLIQADLSTKPTILDNELNEKTYTLPVAFNNTDGFTFFPFNKAVYPVDPSTVISAQNSSSQLTNFAAIMKGNYGGYPSRNTPFMVAQTSYSSAKGQYFNYLSVLTGFPNAVGRVPLSWPTVKYPDASGTKERNNVATSFNQLDYDQGGQVDLSEWMVGKNRSDPTDDDANQVPEVVPPSDPPTEWEEGEYVVDAGKKTAEAYQKYWDDRFGTYEALPTGSISGSINTQYLTSFEYELEKESPPDILSKTQSLESEIETTLSRHKIYNDLKTLFAPLQSAAPFSYDFDVEFELPDVVRGVSAGGSSSGGGSSIGESYSGGGTFSPAPPETINVGSFSFDMSMFYENQTVYRIVQVIRQILLFIMIALAYIGTIRTSIRAISFGFFPR